MEKTCIKCGNQFNAASGRFKYCPECAKEARLERARANSRLKYAMHADVIKEKVKERYIKKAEEIKEYQRQYRKAHKEELAIKDRMRKSRIPKHPFEIEICCEKCGKTVIAHTPRRRFCDECSKIQQLERDRRSREKNYNPERRRDYARKYYGDKNLKRNQQKGIEKQNYLMQYASRKPLEISDPMEFSSVGVKRLSQNLCECLECGKEYVLCKDFSKGQPVQILRRRIESKKNPCPYCGTWPIGSALKSTSEMEIATLFPNFTMRNCRFEWLDNQELDLFDPVAKVAIEYHGLRWHSSLMEHDRNYHKQKADLAEAAGIQLLQIWENEWLLHKDIVIDKINAILHGGLVRIGARKLELREMNSERDRKEVSVFLDENHIQGKAPCQWAVALYNGDEMVAACTFKYGTGYASGGISSSLEHYWELNRYATKLGLSIPGGISRCIKAFSIAKPDVQRIVSFADRRWTCQHRSAYTCSGFEAVCTIPTNYMYSDLKPKHPFINKQYMRKSTIAKRASVPGSPEASVYSPDKTETQMAEELGFYKVWDAGKIKYELKLK